MKSQKPVLPGPGVAAFDSTPGWESGFGAALVHREREDLVVILAGYADRMDRFFGPGGTP